jgi:hypothetical protein
MKYKQSKMEAIITSFFILGCELLGLAISALAMTLTTFMAWSIVLHPILGLPALTFGQIFLCAWAFVFCVASVKQIEFYYEGFSIEEIRKEVEKNIGEQMEDEEEEDDDKKY